MNDLSGIEKYNEHCAVCECNKQRLLVTDIPTNQRQIPVNNTRMF